MKNRISIMILIITCLFLSHPSSVLADDPTTVPSAAQPVAVTPPTAQATATPPKSSRSKSLSFDDSVVEGMNQNSKDSLEVIEKGAGKGRQHLYQKRADFKKEIQNFPSELGYSP